MRRTLIIAVGLVVALTMSIGPRPRQGWSADGDPNPCAAGQTEFKDDNLSGETYTVPDFTGLGWDIVAVWVKAGNTEHFYGEPPQLEGRTLQVKADTGHDVSHVHLCKIRVTQVTTTTEATTSSTSSTSTTPTTTQPTTSTTSASTTTAPPDTTTSTSVPSTSSSTTTEPSTTSSSTTTTSSLPASTSTPATSTTSPSSTSPSTTTSSSSTSTLPTSSSTTEPAATTTTLIGSPTTGERPTTTSSLPSPTSSTVASPPTPDSTPPSDLPETGSDVLFWLVVGIASVGLGTVVVILLRAKPQR